ncbi:alkaline phosphatase D family protein [Dyadobacter tibetensis]|uniref:alkaline phosphatase D family protein n=1 Tax=Dyadobacter tibetensis TaxID=1211851 RepID=UPI000470792A|nr:alkaline phosphatase D family protein [Dyadobacter tibetensis]
MSAKNRRYFLKTAASATGAAFAWTHLSPLYASADSPEVEGQDVFFTNGMKIAEVSNTAVIIWTRLCAQARPQPIVHQRREEVFRHPLAFDESGSVSQMDGAVAGQNGMARVSLKSPGFAYQSDWQTCTLENDHTTQIEINNLVPNQEYEVRWEAKTQENAPVYSMTGNFRTPPEHNMPADISLVTSTCQYFWSFDDPHRGFQSYDAMRKLQPDFFIHTGDYIYYDKPGPMATDIEKARHKWHAMNGWPALRDFFARTPIYMLKDDHDLLRDDVDPSRPLFGKLSYADGLKIWRENAPLHDKPYRTIRWGQHLQIWLLEGREYRSKNQDLDGPEKTILGKVQKQWLAETVSTSDATFKLLFSPTPVVGPDRPKKIDNHANESYKTEGSWLRKLIAQQGNMYVVNGDRHWQYVSEDPETKIMEFGSGPVSDYHAQGWAPDDRHPEHRFLRVKGGFLGIAVKTLPKIGPQIIFSHYDIKGQLVHQEKFVSKQVNKDE